MLRRSRAALLVVLAGLARGFPGIAAAAPVPAEGFQDTLVVAGLDQPTALGFAPDGRLLIAEKATGRVRVFRNGRLLPEPMLELAGIVPVDGFLDAYLERGLVGLALHPSFESEPLLYVYYTICRTTDGITCPSADNRVSRFRVEGDRVDAASHVLILKDIDARGAIHNGGWLGFGPLDGRLYIAVGDGGMTPAWAQDVRQPHGKILRLAADGSVPPDNPYIGVFGARPEVWATGLRNPFRCRFHPQGTLLCGDVGNETWEEINAIVRGGNYGWPTTEGPFDPALHPGVTPPLYAYPHQYGYRASVIGGEFGVRTNFPDEHQRSYFFADFVRGLIRRATLDANGAFESVENFVTEIGTNNVTDLVAGPDGALYYTNWIEGAVRRVGRVGANRWPVARASASPTEGLPPLAVQFSAADSTDPDDDPLSFAWDFGDGSAESDEAEPLHVYERAGVYAAAVRVGDGEGYDLATVNVTVGQPPTVTILAPENGARYRAGSPVTLLGRAVDAAGRTVASASMRWRIIFHHRDHIHPFIEQLVGSQASFVVPSVGETDWDVGYEVFLRATDADGLGSTESVRIFPETAMVTLTTEPPGLTVTLDDQPVATPAAVLGVVGFRRLIGAPSPQDHDGRRWFFAGWSDGGAQSHEITTPEADTIFVAAFAERFPCELHACDDDDACTADGCDPATGCLHVEHAPASLEAVRCKLEQLRGMLGGATLCSRRCAREIDRHVGKMDRLLGRVSATAGARRCKRTLAGAARAARRLERRFARLLPAALAPLQPDDLEQLAVAVTKLRVRTAALARAFCVSR
jgi:glucose/arabinose dehydrogenase